MLNRPQRMLRFLPDHRGVVRSVLTGLVAVVSVILVRAGISNERAAVSVPPPAPIDSPSRTHVSTPVGAAGYSTHLRSNFIGSKACLDCHRSEFVSWIGSQHYLNTKKNRFEDTENSIAGKYRRLTGNLDRCYTCHAVPADQKFGRTYIESGVSCESCHGAAGGPDGWLNRHAVYGPNVTRMHEESPQHYVDRISFCDQAGMRRSGNQYELAKTCLGCHLIGDPALVGDQVGHPVSFDKYSLIPYMQGEVRHNFHLNPRQNAEAPTVDSHRRGVSSAERQRVYLILEQFAKAEIALTYLAGLPSDEAFDEDYAGKFLDLFDDAAGEMEDFMEVLLEPEEDNIPPLTEPQVAPLQQFIDAFEEFDDLDEPTRAHAAAAAGQVGALAQAFLDLHADGSLLQALDVEFIEDLGEPVGQPLMPR